MAAPEAGGASGETPAPAKKRPVGRPPSGCTKDDWDEEKGEYVPKSTETGASGSGATASAVKRPAGRPPAGCSKEDWEDALPDKVMRKWPGLPGKYHSQETTTTVKMKISEYNEYQKVQFYKLAEAYDNLQKDGHRNYVLGYETESVDFDTIVVREYHQG